LKPMSGKDMCRILEENGWRLRRVAGSHHIYTKPGVESTISVPVHAGKELKIGMQASILKTAGIRLD